MGDWGGLTKSYLKKGVSIQKWLRTNVEILIRLASALQSMHEKEYAHRDIKRANVCVHKNGGKWEAKLINFGYAKKFQKARQVNGKAGTPIYAAPEVLESFDYN